MTNAITAMRHAVRDHLVKGYPITRLEAEIFYGMQSLTAEITRMRQEGWLVQSKKVPMAKAIRRVNQQCVLTPPSSLPIKQITVEEYWVES